MKYYLGIDGGGSKTAALLCDENLQTVSSFTGGEINYRSVGFSAARNNLAAVIEGVLGGRDIRLSSVFIGHAALSGKADEALIRDFCGGVVPCGRIGMDSDLYIALEAMEAPGPAAVAICGTGSMAAGRLPDGTVIHTGGWGYLLGDEGSGFAVALDALKAAIRGGEGAGPRTALTQSLLSYFRCGSLEGLIDLVYAPVIPRRQIAAFAPEVFRCAAGGDETARRIIDDHSAHFADTLGALLRQLPAGCPVGLWGGMFQYQPEYRAAFIQRIKKDFPSSQIGILRRPPEYGAVLAAVKAERECESV